MHRPKIIEKQSGIDPQEIRGKQHCLFVLPAVRKFPNSKACRYSTFSGAHGKVRHKTGIPEENPSQQRSRPGLQAGKISGERVNAFPLDADYEEDLDSQVADIKQCTLGDDADHILAARFLMRFVGNDTTWLHLDLSASNCKGGLSAVASDITDFGVAWSMAFLGRARYKL